MASPFDWEAAGIRLGETLDDRHAIVVVGVEPVATALVALGIARAQAPRRHAAVCDLLGEAPPLQSLAGDDPHGIVDAFEFGVSLNRIAREVPGRPGLFVIPTGSDARYAEGLLDHPGWRRVAAGFRERGALLVLAVRADAEGVDTLVAQADGSVLVGEFVPPSLPVASVISSVRRPRPVPLAEGGAPSGAGTGIDAVGAPQRALTPVRLLQGAAAVLAIGALGVWFAMRPLDHSVRRPVTPAPDTTRPAGAIIPGMTGATAAGAVAAGGTGDSTAVPVVENPADSAQSAAFAVELLATNTLAGAAARIREEGDRTPATTFTPAVVDGAEWFKVVAGAWRTRAPADSLLALLRRSGQLDARSGRVVWLPYAYLVHSDVAPERVKGVLGAYRDLGQPVYALQQADGTLNVYAGAFATPAEAALLASTLRAAGVTPKLVFRTGRVL